MEKVTNFLHPPHPKLEQWNLHSWKASDAQFPVVNLLYVKRLWKWVFNLVIKCYQSCIWTDHWGEECLLDCMFESFASFRSFPVIDCSWSIVSGWLLLWYYCCHCLGNIECERRCVSICCSAFAKAGKKSKQWFFKSQSLVPFYDTFMGWNSSFSNSVSASFKIKLCAVSIVIIIKKGTELFLLDGRCMPVQM